MDMENFEKLKTDVALTVPDSKTRRNQSVKALDAVKKMR
jgi:hypothetical protein